MTDLEDARRLWIEQQGTFEAYAALIADRLNTALRPLGIWFEVSSRAKALDSLLKKLIKKPKDSFASLPDKAGVRVVIRYRSDLERVVETIQTTLHCGSVDWKTLEVSQVDYASVHIDLARLHASDSEQKHFPVNDFWVELQIRTLAQHLWAELSHDSVYKNDETIQTLSLDVQRRVHLMAGQIEIADREFDRLGKETRSEDAAELLRFLEPYYFSLVAKRSDVELSLLILRNLFPLYGQDALAVEARLEKFIAQKMSFLERRFAQAEDGEAPPESPLFYQPEVFLIYERMSDDLTMLRRVWSEHFPEKELENLANDLGISFH